MASETIGAHVQGRPPGQASRSGSLAGERSPACTASTGRCKLHRSNRSSRQPKAHRRGGAPGRTAARPWPRPPAPQTERAQSRGRGQCRGRTRCAPGEVGGGGRQGCVRRGNERRVAGGAEGIAYHARVWGKALASTGAAPLLVQRSPQRRGRTRRRTPAGSPATVEGCRQGQGVVGIMLGGAKGPGEAEQCGHGQAVVSEEWPQPAWHKEVCWKEVQRAAACAQQALASGTCGPAGRWQESTGRAEECPHSACSGQGRVCMQACGVQAGWNACRQARRNKRCSAGPGVWHICEPAGWWQESTGTGQKLITATA